jgi:hypothetical protein
VCLRIIVGSRLTNNANAHMHTFQDKDAKMAFLQKAIDTLCKW